MRQIDRDGEFATGARPDVQATTGHSGGGPGRAVNLEVFPDGGWVVVVLPNHDTDIRPIAAPGRQLVPAAGPRAHAVP